MNMVKTPEEARARIYEHIDKNSLSRGYFTNAYIRCSCGVTKAIEWHGDNIILVVGYCEGCGDDNNFNVINTYRFDENNYSYCQS